MQNTVIYHIHTLIPDILPLSSEIAIFAERSMNKKQ